jgi:hypothetical protein
MDYLPGKVRRASSNHWFLLASGIASIVSVPLTIVLAGWPELVHAEAFRGYLASGLVVLSFFLWAFFVVALYQAFHIQRAFKLTCQVRHEISHVYRDEHGKNNLRIEAGGPAVTLALHGIRERDVFGIVNQKAAIMYRELLGSRCSVETYLCTPGPDTCVVVARSERGNERDRYDDFEFTVSKNTAFVEARAKRVGTSCFLSGDLRMLARNGGYIDEREHWDHLCQSRLVIPIRFKNQEIGFLSLETKSRHRINHTYHVEILASLADDMYAFLHASRCRLAEELRQKASDRLAHESALNKV